MTAALADRSVSAPATIGFGNILRSEWTKLRSVRSTFWTVGVAVVLGLAVGVIQCVESRSNILGGKEGVHGFDAPLSSLVGVYIAQVAFGALGVLAITSEYGTGMIRATVAAVPQRRAMVAAKQIVLTGSVLVVAEVLSFVSFGIGQAILSPAHVSVGLGAPGALRATVGGGLYLTAVAVLGFGLGALIRHTAGALSAFFGILFALTVVVDLLPTNLRNDLINYLPANAGSQIITTHPTIDALSPWVGLGVLCLYAVVPLIAAFALIERRDT